MERATDEARSAAPSGMERATDDARSAAPSGMERVLSTRVAFSGEYLKVRVDEVESSDGHRSKREVVETRGAVAIVCVHDGELVLVRQYRGPAGKVMLEIPAGIVDEGEDPKDTAARELAEEVGLRPRKLSHLIRYLASPGFTNHCVDIYFTDEVEETTMNRDEGEVMEVERRPLSSVRELLGSGEVSDSKTLIGLALFALQGT